MSRTEKKLEACLENGQYYEAHQIYRLLYNRMVAQAKWSELLEMLYSGTLKLMSVGEVNSALDLAELFVDVLERSATPVSTAVLDRFEENSNRSDEEDRRKKLIGLAIKWSMAVSDKRRWRRFGHPQLHSRLAMCLWRENNYTGARTHFIHSDDVENFSHYLIKMQQKLGYATEKDLFIVQAILQLMCNRRPRVASALLQEYCSNHPDIGQKMPYPFPLLNFLHFTIISAQKKQATYYSILVEKYAEQLSRDKEYRTYLDKIGQIYFGMPPPQNAAAGLLGNLFKSLMKNPENTATSTTRPEFDSDEECFFVQPPSKASTSGSMSKQQPQSSKMVSPVTDDIDLD